MENDPQDRVQLEPDQQSGDVPGAAPGKLLAPAARRALEEAAARRAAAVEATRPPEDGGPAGPEPTRYGDWERKGVAVDF
jgi:hypothetical protein